MYDTGPTSNDSAWTTGAGAVENSYSFMCGLSFSSFVSPANSVVMLSLKGASALLPRCTGTVGIHSTANKRGGEVCLLSAKSDYHSNDDKHYRD